NVSKCNLLLYTSADTRVLSLSLTNTHTHTHTHTHTLQQLQQPGLNQEPFSICLNRERRGGRREGPMKWRGERKGGREEERGEDGRGRGEEGGCGAEVTERDTQTA